MGSWNGTCMISNLPIIEGEKVKLIILHDGFNRDRYSGGFCNANGLMAPLFLPINGEYNDGGMIEEIEEDWNFHFITKMLKEAYNQIEVEGKIINDFTLEDILTGIERCSLKVKRNRDAVTAPDKELVSADMAFAIIREDVWNSICNEFVGEKFNDNREELDKEIYYIPVKTFCERKIKVNLECLAKLKEIEATGDDRAAMRYSMIEMRDSEIFRGFPTILVKHNYDYSELLKTSTNVDEITNAWTELVIIDKFLEDTRKSWFVQQGAGAQNADWATYKLLNKIVDEICDKKISEYE